MISVLIAEDHTIVRAGIRALLEKASDVQITGEARDGQEAVQQAEKLLPDVIVMDIMMPRMNGIQAAEKIHLLKLRSRVVLLSMYSEPALVYQAIQSGIKGYVLKSSLSEELLWAVRAAARGETFLSSPISEIMVNTVLNPRPVNAPTDPITLLSPREKEILKLVAEEHTSGEIAEMLFISEKTVERHRANLIEKLQVRNLAGLVRLAIKHDLTHIDQ